MQMAIANEDFDLIHVLLSEDRIPRPITYDCEWPRFALHALTDDQCWANFRFVKQDIARLATQLSLQMSFVCRTAACVRGWMLCALFSGGSPTPTACAISNHSLGGRVLHCR